MVQLKTLVATSVALSAVLAVIAFLNSNWMWLIVDALCVVLLVIPNVKDLGYTYNRALVTMTFLAPVCSIILHFAGMASDIDEMELWEVNSYTYLMAAIQAYQSFLIGFMLALVMDRSYGLTMTPSWLVVFALAFAMAVSALDVFFTFGELYAEGYPVFNRDFYDGDIYTNSIIMATPLTYFIVTLVMAVRLVLRLRGSDKSLFLTTEGSHEAHRDL